MKSHLGNDSFSVTIFYFLIIFIVFSISIYATDYYVSFNSGNDSNNGLSPTSAWKTLNKVNSFTFLPGDNIYLQRGNIWREALKLSSSNNGNAGNYIKITAWKWCKATDKRC